MPGLLIAGLLVSLLLHPQMVASQERTWNREENIVAAARAIAEIQKSRGAEGAAAIIETCYRQFVEPVQNYSRQAEGCLAQDILHARMTAAFYDTLSEDARRQNGLPAPGAVMEAMGKRVNDALQRFAVSPEEARALLEVVNSKGEPAFMKARFPNQ